MTKQSRLPAIPKATLERKRPSAMVGRIQNSIAADKMPGLPVPPRNTVQAFTSQDILDRWGEESAGLRALEGGDNVITMFSVIGEDYWSDGITASQVAKQLRAIGGPVEVQINSPGGDVFEGFAIYNILREHPYKVSVKVVGMAASAASIIAMAGDEITIGSAAFIMIHNCWCIGVGNRHEFRELADFLDPFDQALVDVYVARTGQSEKDIKKWMDAETYMSGSMSVERKFADSLLPSDQITKDEETKAADRQTNEVRSLETMLLASGLSRTQARERINRVKGKRDAAPNPPEDEGMPDAAEMLAAGAGELLASLQTKWSI